MRRHNMASEGMKRSPKTNGKKQSARASLSAPASGTAGLWADQDKDGKIEKALRFK
jgi:hypothetical protein